MNKKVPMWFVLLLLWFSFVITILFGWAVLHVERAGNSFNKQLSATIIAVASLPSLVKESYLSVFSKSILARPNIYPDIHGLNVKKKYVDSNYILLSTYDYKLNQSVVKLMRIYDQKIIHQWTPDYEELINLFGKKFYFWGKAKKHDLQMMHPLLASDGSIVFKFPGVLSPLIKIDKDSKFKWIVNGLFTHSIEYDSDGNIWTPSVIENSKLLPFFEDFEDDAISKLSTDGKLLFEKSVAKILIENGYRGLMLGSFNEADPVHLNDVQPALASTRYWMKGDLLLSLRNKSTVLLYRPSTNKVIWLKTGPWLNQHDVDFIDSTHIGIFGNNIIRYMIGFDKNVNAATLLNGYNEEYIYDFKTDKIDTPYTEFLKKAKVATLSEGRSDILQNGDIFIEETNNNRLLRGTKKDIVWQYVDRIDDHSVAALSWSRYITKEEFKKLTFLKK